MDKSGTDEGLGTPAWVQDAVFYQIFPDRFAQSVLVAKPSNLESWDSPPTTHGFKGGDLLGVVEHLDYLQNLGITAIYLCPVFRSTANHRYHTHDYFAIDPILGGNEAFQTLLKEAHGRGLRVILDGVFNHCGRGFYQFNHLLENSQGSPYIDWFSVQSWPLFPYGPNDQSPGYSCWWGERALPEFNTSTPAVREFLWSVGEYWIRQGIDGWRLDVPNEIDDDDFWREFRRRVRAINPETYIVGEIWGDARRWLAGDQFDAVMNYPFTRACLGYFTHQNGLDNGLVAGTGLDSIETLDTAGFARALETMVTMYPWSIATTQLNLLDSHDTARFLSIAKGDVSAFELALLLEMTFVGAPCIYYGDEVGLEGGKDPDDRRAFLWDRSRWNESWHQYVRRAIALRREHDVLRRGTFTVLSAQTDVLVYLRQLGTTAAIVAINASTTPQDVNIDLPSQLSATRKVWGEHAPKSTDAGVHGWHVPARSGAVLIGTMSEDAPVT